MDQPDYPLPHADLDLCFISLEDPCGFIIYRIADYKAEHFQKDHAPAERKIFIATFAAARSGLPGDLGYSLDKWPI
jgi:hypothetical protein